jgi:Ca2+-binding RTX toxin-like protein
MPSRSALCLLFLLGAMLLWSTSVSAKASHAGWPQINGKLIINKQNASETMRGDPDAHNELLGGNGNDTIYGGNVGDVIWGDYEPSGQPTTQVDRIYAGNGNNFVYTSHGTNYVFTGTGRTVVHAHFGRGVIHCQSADVTVIVTHHTGYELPGCRHIELG